MKSSTGFLEFDFKDQLNTFEYIYKELLCKLPKEVWSFGGGTVLSMYYFHHRASFDIDIFINDPQYFTYLSPKFYIEEDDFFQKNFIETANQISLKTKDGIKVDFVLTPSLTKDPFKIIKDNDKEFQIETIEEIIAKKLFYRKKDNKTRDILDIIYAIHNDNLIIKKLIDENIISLDILFDFEKAIQNLDEEEFIKETEKIAFSKDLLDIAYDAKKFLLEYLKKINNLIKLELFINNFNKLENLSLEAKKLKKEYKEIKQELLKMNLPNEIKEKIEKDLIELIDLDDLEKIFKKDKEEKIKNNKFELQRPKP